MVIVLDIWKVSILLSAVSIFWYLIFESHSIIIILLLKSGTTQGVQNTVDV